jgi:hypothetical protein
MTRKPYELTPALERAITAYIRAGGFPQVAAEAAGVPRRLFVKWLRAARDKDGNVVYQDFRAAVRQAQAQARLQAEVAVLKAKPLDWLKCGPGKDRPGVPGWSVAPRAQSRGEERNPLLDPAFQRMLTVLLDALAPQPEIRAAVAKVWDEARCEQAGESLS